MLRYFILEIVVPLLIFLFLRSIIGRLFQSRSSTAVRNSPPQSPPSVVAGGELKKDPVCGTYVSASGSVTRSVNGQLLHFCSTACRDKYRAA